ncbi:MAG TPA: hypothetical protein VN634_06680 [Candidatus Limnocylindrales bacterium]|nr:hypothetical protein [Candidatus Limnocylindrales bacterium]
MNERENVEANQCHEAGGKKDREVGSIGWQARYFYLAICMQRSASRTV